MNVEIILALVAGPLVLAAHTYETLRKSRQRPHRESLDLLVQRKGSFLATGAPDMTPIDRQWMEREIEMNERQRKLDASQNVMTRLL